jgi:hypothetical protein
MDLNTGIITVSLNHTLQIQELHMKKVFHFHLKSSQIMPRTNLNCWILTAAIILSHWTENCSHEVFNSHDQLFSNYKPSAAVSHWETDS